MEKLPEKKLSAILGVKEIKSFSHLGAVERHNRRLEAPLNADVERKHLNVDCMPEWGGCSFEARHRQLLTRDHVGQVHKRAVIALELFLGMSPEAQATIPLDRWQESALCAALEIGGGRGNFVSLDFHYDEKTPHFHGVFLPLLEVTRKARGPKPVTGVRRERKMHVLSFAKFAGGKTREVGDTYRRWHDIYARHVQPYGLERGFPGGRCDHMPQRQLYLRTAELTTEGEALQELLVDPLPLFRALRRPTMAELQHDALWSIYLRDISGFAAKKFLALAPHGARGLVESAKDGLFARRAGEKMAGLELLRRQWQDRAEIAERNLEISRVSGQREVEVLRTKLGELQASPLTPRQATDYFGLPVMSLSKRAGEIIDRVVTATGEVLVLQPDQFVRPDGTKQSVIKFVQGEMGLESASRALAALSKMVGPACAEATFLAPFKSAAVAFDGLVPGATKVLPVTRLTALQVDLETNLGIRLESSGSLIDEKILTVDSRGRGVLVADRSRAGYVFESAQPACPLVGRPSTFEPVLLGERDAWTTVLCDDPALALQVYNASQGLVCAQLVSPACVTEENLNRLKRGHREFLAVQSIFTRGWDPAQSATLLSQEKCLEAAGVATRRDSKLAPATPTTVLPEPNRLSVS